MKQRLRHILTLLAILAVSAWAYGRDFNDKLLNRPYADNRAWHLGFSVGAFVSDLRLTHNGFVTESGQEWRVDQPGYQPGFCVNGLVDFRLNDYFAVRLSPGMYFGSRDLTFKDVRSDATERQNLKTTLVVVPLELKYSAVRMRNARPYMLAGVMPAFDVGKKRSDFLKLKATDFFLSFGFGCDFYLPYFKFIPEVKFCLGLSDVLDHKRSDLTDDPEKFKFTQSLGKATSKMVVLTFYFE